MKTKYIFLAALSALALTSCKDFLDEHYLGSRQDKEQVAQTVDAIPERIDASVTGMYAKLGDPYAYFGTSNNRADDMAYPAVALSLDLNSGDVVTIVSGYDWFSVASEYTDRTPNYANPRMRQGLLYNVIYATVEVLASIPDDTENAELIAKRGQAKAIRAFAYLSLAPYYQFKYVGHEDDPSLPIMSDENDPLNNPRASLKDLYAYILQDLTDAIEDLEGYKRPNKGIIDQQVAYGLRARAYLNMEEWANAAADAEKAMEGYTPYSAQEVSQPGFYNASDHNWIWAILIPQEKAGSAYATWPSQLGSFSGQAYTAGTGVYRMINSLLYNKIPQSDVRRGWWINENMESPLLEGLAWKDDAEGVTYRGQEIVQAKIADVKEPFTQYTNVKFGQRSGVGSSYNDGDWCLMRAEEMILIIAEAKAKAGDLAAGKAVLEGFVQANRDPEFVSKAGSVEAFSDEVLLQRRIELWGEGFAMGDRMRLGKNIVKFHPGDASTNVPETYRFNISADDRWLLMRFPQTELNGNASIIQNEGGNQPVQGDGAGLLDGVTD